MYACKVVTGIVIRSTNHNLFNWLFIFARMNNHHRLNHTMLSAQPEHKNFDSQCLTTHHNSSLWNLRCPLLLFVLLLALSPPLIPEPAKSARFRSESTLFNGIHCGGGELPNFGLFCMHKRMIFKAWQIEMIAKSEVRFFSWLRVGIRMFAVAMLRLWDIGKFGWKAFKRMSQSAAIHSGDS